MLFYQEAPRGPWLYGGAGSFPADRQRRRRSHPLTVNGKASVFSCIRKPTTACSTFPQQSPGLFPEVVRFNANSRGEPLDAGKQVHGRGSIGGRLRVGLPSFLEGRRDSLTTPAHTQHGIWAASKPPSHPFTVTTWEPGDVAYLLTDSGQS